MMKLEWYEIYAAVGLLTLVGYYALGGRKGKVDLLAELIGSNEVALILYLVAWPLFLPFLIWSAFFRKDRKKWVLHGEDPEP
jgi:hypothetical protein